MHEPSHRLVEPWSTSVIQKQGLISLPRGKSRVFSIDASISHALITVSWVINKTRIGVMSEKLFSYPHLF